MPDRTFQRFSDFWPYYLNQHRHASCRALHYLGTASLLVVTGVAAVYSWWLLLLLPVAGYTPSWLGHFLIEKNRPATFGRPLWAALADFKMFGLALTGRLGRHLEAAAAIEDAEPETGGAAGRSHVAVARSSLAFVAGSTGTEIEPLLMTISQGIHTVL